MASRDALINDIALVVERGRGLSDDLILFVGGIKPGDLIGNVSTMLVVRDLAVRRFDETVLVNGGIGGEVRDQADIRTFRCLHGAEAAVVSLVHVADLKAGALAAESARTHSVESALMNDLVERVDLRHELRQLGAGEELADTGNDRTNVDELAGSNGGSVVDRHTVLHNTLHPSQTDAELALHQLSD